MTSLSNCILGLSFLIITRTKEGNEIFCPTNYCFYFGSRARINSHTQASGAASPKIWGVAKCLSLGE